LLYSIAEGLINTFTGLSFTGSTAHFGLTSSWSAFGSALAMLPEIGFNVVAYAIMFFVWISAAWIIIRILGFGR
ncbi:MAG: hypothetical protein QW100_02275, partial [Thermoplasmatales archaeon]